MAVVLGDWYFGSGYSEWINQSWLRWFRLVGLTPRLTGAGARSAQGTNTGHKNAEGMASVGVRVEPPVSLQPLC
jgi:hypothetical protein